MLRLNNIMPLSKSSARVLEEKRVTGRLGFTCTFTLNDAADRPWAQEMTVDINVSVVGEHDDRAELMHAQNTYAVGFTEAADGASPEVTDAVWPYVRPDVVECFRTYGLPADAIPLHLTASEDDGIAEDAAGPV